jgi:hypothetical protein
MNQHQFDRSVLLYTLYLFTSLFIISILTYTGFILQSRVESPLFVYKNEDSFDISFYVYIHQQKEGSSENPNLYESLCVVTLQECYIKIFNPTSKHFLDDHMNPGDRQGYAIEINNLDENLILDIHLDDLRSAGFDHIFNKAQVAYELEIIQLSIINHADNQVSHMDIELFRYHFQHNQNDRYPLIENIKLQKAETLIIYFDLYFDPTILGQTLDGHSHIDQRIFINQIFTIRHITITSRKEESS